MGKLDSYRDEQLLTLLKSDNEQAFSVLFDRYWERLLAIAHYKLPSSDDAKEVVQTVFIQLWERRKRLELQYGFHTYIAAAVRYQVINMLNAQAHPNRTLVVVQSEEQAEKEWLQAFEMADELEKSLYQLPEKCRLVFRLSKQQGLSQREVATQLNISEKTVEAHLSKAYKHLRLSLRHYFYFFL